MTANRMNDDTSEPDLGSRIMRTPPDLPNELLLQIFREFRAAKNDPHTQAFGAFAAVSHCAATLANICCSSSHFRALAEPLLYSVYIKPETDIDWMYPERTAVQQPNGKLRLFLRTIIERPVLASYLRDLRLTSWSSADNLITQIRPVTSCSPGTPLLKQFCRGVTGLTRFIGQRLADQWKIALGAGDEDAEVALLMALAFNTRKLTVDFVIDYEPYAKPSNILWFRRLLRALMARPVSICLGRPLSNLRELEVSTDGWSDEHPVTGYPIRILSELIALPTLTSLEAWTTYEMISLPTPKFWDCLSNTSNLRRLNLTNCALSTASIHELIACCKSLEELNLCFGPPCLEEYVDEDTQLPSVTWPQVVEALASQQRSLRKLSLGAAAKSPLTTREPYDDGVQWAPLSSLKQFTVLQELSIPQSAILGPDEDSRWNYSLPQLLPPSIKALGIKDCTASLLSRFDIGEIKQDQPCLETLKISMVGHGKVSDEYKACLETWDSFYARHGKHIVIVEGVL